MSENSTPPKSTPPAATGERTLLEGILHYAGILLRYKWLVIITTAVAATGSVAFSIATLRLPVEVNPMPNQYSANASLLLQTDDAGSLNTASLLSSFGFEGASGGINAGQVVQRVIVSRPFLDTIVDEFKIVERHQIISTPRSTSRTIVLRSMSAGFDDRAGILNISYTDTDPEFAARVVNRMVSLLEEWFAQFGGSSQQRQVIELQEKLLEVEEQVQRLESQIVARQQELGVLRVEEIADVQTGMLADLQAQLVQLEIEIRNYEQRTRIEDATLANLRSQRRNLQQLIREVEAGYTGGNKTMPARDDLPQISLELSRLQAELTIQMRIYETLSQQYEVTRLAAESEPVITVLEAAEVPEEKSGPERGRFCMMVTVGAFFGSIALAFLFHLIRNVIFDPEKLKLLRRDDL